MIFSSGNPYTDLYMKNLISEIFPEACFSESLNIFANAHVTCDDKRVKTELTINGEDFTSDEILSHHQNTNLATTTALGKAIISYAERKGKSVPPYGVLVGVRPFKIASFLLSRYTQEEAIENLKNRYLISDDKIRLLISSAEYNARLRKNHKSKDCSVYISIPFCPSRCNYCSFVSSAIPTKLDMLNVYIDKLTEEIKKLSEFIQKNQFNVKSIYIGGGTPTVLSPVQLKKLTDIITREFNIRDLQEFTVEAGRPDTVTEEKTQILKNCGVSRICINCQTTNNDVLKAIGRHHTKEEFFSVFEMVKKYGFKTVNTDIIAGLETESLESFKSTVNDVIFLDPESITVHTLCLKKSSDMKVSGRCDILSENISKFIEYSVNQCITSGYEPYYLYKQKYSVGNHENVGYCKKGHDSYYNIAMMNEIETVFGVGAGATTKVTDFNTNGKIEHFENFKYPTEYIKDNSKQNNNFLKIQELINSCKQL